MGDLKDRVDVLAGKLRGLRPLGPNYWKPEAPKVTCAWKDCDESPRENSKYCSRACSNKNARWRYRMRQKGLTP